ncbi:enoyl-CoA hydratase/isomerase family protein [Glaciecola sp. SC05]|uniref:enoyl-CoA hydratase/isomerase family protein n=1 Tax=Glaciecola sp. SC05 TaxID=1987355 RepID=UPI0035276F14
MKVLVNYLDCTTVDGNKTGKRIAQVTLNKPKALNALDLDMVNLMLDALAQIRRDDSVQAVLLDSEGEKAFCAGGDIVSMYHAMKEHRPKAKGDLEAPTPGFLQDFFTQEYRLDYCLHTFPKPVIVWGNGIIMGGGLGLFTASQIKLVTESARIAMPEISIGLFPDVGGSYFLNRLPKGLGLFLGLTAASINAQDTLSIGLADALVLHERKSDFLRTLCQLPSVNKLSVVELANAYSPADDAVSDGKLAAIMQPLSKLDEATSLHDASQVLSQIVAEHPENTYLAKALSSFERGSAITAHLVFEQLHRAKQMSLADCFRMELSMAYTCGALGEFEEGVRALLIDKDNQSAWQYVSIDDVPEATINAHFTRFDDVPSESHPLARLEQDFGL